MVSQLSDPFQSLSNSINLTIYINVCVWLFFFTYHCKENGFNHRWLSTDPTLRLIYTFKVKLLPGFSYVHRTITFLQLIRFTGSIHQFSVTTCSKWSQFQRIPSMTSMTACAMGYLKDVFDVFKASRCIENSSFVSSKH